jgi:hypothetical protein
MQIILLDFVEKPKQGLRPVLGKTKDLTQRAQREKPGDYKKDDDLDSAAAGGNSFSAKHLAYCVE